MERDTSQVWKARAEDEATALMAAEVREGLTSTSRWLPCKYFYDDRGSQLFDRITRLPEYYQTRTEERLLESIADEVIAAVRPRELCEIGSGVGRKIRLLLDSMKRAGLLERCVLFDINELFLKHSVEELARSYPDTEVTGIVGDFSKDLSAIGPGGGRMAIFLAGTVGNLHPSEVPVFLRRLAGSLEPGDGFLLGVDLVKDTARLEAAYNDAEGVTAQFNLNILEVLNRKLGADFEVSSFEHVAFYDRHHAWIEMRLRALRPSIVSIPAADVALRFARGDEIRTEISCKYTRETLSALLPGTGLTMARWFTDPEDLFALALLQKEGSKENGRAAR
jgi:L-histidine Nalpha-methyltransferase